MNVPASNVGSNLMRFLFASHSCCQQRWPPADSLRFPRFESSPRPHVRVLSYVAFLLPRKSEFGAKNDHGQVDNVPAGTAQRKEHLSCVLSCQGSSNFWPEISTSRGGFDDIVDHELRKPDYRVILERTI